jgi:hypothetical protein
MTKLQKVTAFVLARLREGTWCAIGTLLVLAGVHWASRADWASLAGLGVLVSGILKAILPDTLYDGDHDAGNIQ